MSAGRPGRNWGASCSRVARIRFRRNARAVLVGIRRETRGQAAAQPQPVHRFRRRPGDRLHLADIERTQVEVLDAPGQALGLSQPLPRGRTEGQEASGPETPAAPVVPEAAQLGEDPRQAVDLVENGQPLFVGPKEPRQVRHADAVLGQLEVDDDPADLLGDRPRQGGLARLPRPEQTPRRPAGAARPGFGRQRGVGTYIRITSETWDMYVYSPGDRFAARDHRWPNRSGRTAGSRKQRVTGIHRGGGSARDSRARRASFSGAWARARRRTVAASAARSEARSRSARPREADTWRGSTERASR